MVGAVGGVGKELSKQAADLREGRWLWAWELHQKGCQQQGLCHVGVTAGHAAIGIAAGERPARAVVTNVSASGRNGASTLRMGEI